MNVQYNSNFAIIASAPAQFHQQGSTFVIRQIAIMKKLFLLLPAILFFHLSRSQQIADDILHKRWDAFWIAVPGAALHDYGVFHFRKKISLDQKPSSFIIHVSADNRYKLYVNGTMVSFGPARSDIYNWNFETVDIAPYLQKGNNILAAVVWNFG